jgi:hypothetical protein
MALAGVVVAIRFVAPAQRPAVTVPSSDTDVFERLEEAA